MFRFLARLGALVLLLAAAAQAQAPAVSWQRLDGPFGGPALGVASAGGVAVATDGTDLFRSTDAAAWTRVALDRSGFSGVFAAPGGDFWSLGSAVLRSRDGGLTWTGAGGGLPASGAVQIAATPGGALFAATEAGVYRLEPGAALWAPTALRDAAVAIAATPAGTLLAGLATGRNGYAVLRSDDAGATWATVRLNEYTGAVTSALLVLPDGAVLAGGVATAASSTRAQVYRSGDDGRTWTRIPGSPEAFRLARAGGALFALAAPRTAFRSTDGGTTWADTGVTATDAAEAPGGGLLAATRTRGIVRSEDAGETFADATAGFGRARLGAVELAPDGTVYAAAPPSDALGGGVYRRAGAAWVRTDLPFPEPPRLLRVDAAGRLFAAPPACYDEACPPGGLYRSLDRGATWQPTGLLSPVVADVTALVAAPGGVLWATLVTRARTLLLFRSADGGATWDARPDPPVAGPFDVGPDGTLWLAGGSFAYSGGFVDVGVARSLDAGATWGFVFTPELSPVTHALVATRAGGVIVSFEDDGAWGTGLGFVPGSFGTTLAYARVNTLVRSPDGSLFAGADRGARVTRSTDDGQTWAPAAAGLPDGFGTPATPDLAVGSDGVLWAALPDAGLYRTAASTFVAGEAEASAPALALTARPNPARGAAAVTLMLPEAAAAVRVSVADVLGREVAVLHDGPAPAGVLTLALDATRLPAGAYVVRAVAGRTAAAQRLVVVR